MIPATRTEDGRRRSGKRLSWTSRSEQGTRLRAKFPFRPDPRRPRPPEANPAGAKSETLLCAGYGQCESLYLASPLGQPLSPRKRPSVPGCGAYQIC